MISCLSNIVFFWKLFFNCTLRFVGDSKFKLQDIVVQFLKVKCHLNVASKNPINKNGYSLCIIETLWWIYALDVMCWACGPLPNYLISGDASLHLPFYGSYHRFINGTQFTAPFHSRFYGLKPAHVDGNENYKG